MSFSKNIKINSFTKYLLNVDCVSALLYALGTQDWIRHIGVYIILHGKDGNGK